MHKSVYRRSVNRLVWERSERGESPTSFDVAGD